MKKIKTCFLNIEKQFSNKIFNEMLLIDNTRSSSFLYKTYFCFSDISNSNNKSFNNKNSPRDNFTKGNTLDNLIKIRRHDKKSDYNKDQFNRLKIDPNDESFYGKINNIAK